MKKKLHSTKHSELDYAKGLRILRRKFPDFKKLSDNYKPEFNLKTRRSPYEALIRAVANQQLHMKAAATITARFIALYPGKKFPTPEQVLKTSNEELRKCGFSENKVKAIKDIAEKTLTGVVPTKSETAKLSNEELIERLIPLRGIGQWTVEMVLLFQLGRLDVWPVDDFGIRRGYQIWKGLSQMPTAKELKDKGDSYAPYQSILSLHLWQLSNTTRTV
jgi:DNA-3-methyladenine glycosylase II